MKYKINNHIIDAKSPTEALKVHKLVSKVKDAEPINVENIPYKNDKYVVLEFTHNGNKKYFVVAKENYHNEKRYTGGGILEYDLSSAKKTADDFLKMNGKSYKEWMNNRDSKVKDDESLQEKIRKAQEWVDFDIKHHGEVSELTKRDIEKMGLKFNKWDNQVTDSVKDSDDIDYLSQEEEQAIEDYKKAIMNTNDVKLLKLFAHILKEETEHLEELQNEEVEDSVNDSIEIKVSLEGKTYKGHYTGKSNKYDDMGEVFISELVDYNNEKNTPKDDVGLYPKDGKYYISMKHILKDNPYLKMFK